MILFFFELFYFEAYSTTFAVLLGLVALFGCDSSDWVVPAEEKGEEDKEKLLAKV
jgi:hypothetical protein